MPQGLTQRRNNQMVRLLSSDFQLRFEPNFAWKSAASCYQSLTALRGFWPMSSAYHLAAGRLRDQSACGNHLTPSGDQAEPVFMFQYLIPHIVFDDEDSQFYFSTDAGAGDWADIIGNEAYIGPHGLTCMSWVYIFGSTNDRQTILSKWDETGNDRSYLLEMQLAGTGRFAVSTNGVAEVAVTSTANLPLATWFFIAGRFNPDVAELHLFVNDTIYENAVGVPATLNDSDADFQLGAIADPNYYLNGAESYTALCAAALSDTIILSVFNQTRAMFNV